VLEWPFSHNYEVTSPFGVRVHPLSGERRPHNGTDYKTPFLTPIYAPESGEVIFLGEDERSGLFVGIKGKYLISFAHLEDVTVAKGARISAGDLIALSGKSGDVTGPHVHIRIREDGKNIDPETLLIFNDDEAGPGLIAVAAAALAVL